MDGKSFHEFEGDVRLDVEMTAGGQIVPESRPEHPFAVFPADWNDENTKGG